MRSYKLLQGLQFLCCLHPPNSTDSGNWTSTNTFSSASHKNVSSSHSPSSSSLAHLLFQWGISNQLSPSSHSSAISFDVLPPLFNRIFLTYYSHLCLGLQLCYFPFSFIIKNVFGILPSFIIIHNHSVAIQFTFQALTSNSISFNSYLLPLFLLNFLQTWAILSHPRLSYHPKTTFCTLPKDTACK